MGVANEVAGEYSIIYISIAQHRWFKKVMETFLWGFGPYGHDGILQHISKEDKKLQCFYFIKTILCKSKDCDDWINWRYHLELCSLIIHTERLLKTQI